MMEGRKNIIKFFGIVLTATFLFGVFFENASADSTGTYTSVPKDAAANGANWTSFSWTENKPAGTSITMSVRSCTQSNCSDKGSWTGCGITNGGTLVGHACMTPGNRYVQYQATLNSTNDNIPEVQSATVNYYYFNGTYSLLSSPYNTTDPLNALGKISWSESDVDGTIKDVKFQVRTATNNNNGTPGDPSDDTPSTWFPAGGSFCGPDNATGGTCNTGTYFSDPTGLSEPIDDDMKGGTSDQWIQYKVYLSATTSWQSPSVQDATMTYVVNAPPTVSGVTASQNSDGTISIGYTLADTDSTSFTVSAYADIGVTLNEVLTSSDTTITLSSVSLLPASGTVAIDSEQISYTGKSGNDLTGCTRGVNTTTANSHSSGAIVWAKAVTTAPGDNIGAGQTVGSGKSVTWTIKTDFNGVYRNSSQGMIRVTANDGNAANQVGNDDSATFEIDTKDPIPAGNSQIVDATSDPADLTISATDDTSMTMRHGIDLVNDDCSVAGDVTWDSQGWIAYNASSTTDLDSNDPVTICTQFKDSKSNTAMSEADETPETPTNIMAQDTTNTYTDPDELRIFVAWQQNVEGDFNEYSIRSCTTNCTTTGTYTEITTL